LKLLKQPQALFGFPSPDGLALQAFTSYVGQVAKTIERTPWDQDVVELLDLIPQVFLHLAADAEIQHNSLQVLVKHMYVVFEAYQRDFDPELEDIMQLSPEYTYRLLQLFRSNRSLRPSHPVEVYKKALLLDPEWALRWCQECHDTPYFSEIMQHVAQTKDSNARSAIVSHRLTTSGLERHRQLEDIRRKLPLLMRDPQVCFWIMQHYPELDRKVLFRSAIGNPPYLLLWAQQFPREFDPLIRRELMLHPAWLADYITLFNPPDAREMWFYARERCSNDWLLSWLNQYAKAANWE